MLTSLDRALNDMKYLLAKYAPRQFTEMHLAQIKLSSTFRGFPEMDGDRDEIVAILEDVGEIEAKGNQEKDVKLVPLAQ
jgi:hypothetical protein